MSQPQGTGMKRKHRRHGQHFKVVEENEGATMKIIRFIQDPHRKRTGKSKDQNDEDKIMGSPQRVTMWAQDHRFLSLQHHCRPLFSRRLPTPYLAHLN